MLPRGMGDRPLVPLRSTKAVLSALALGCLVVLIALGSASTDGGPTRAALITEYGPALFRAVFILVAVGEGLVIVLVVWALWPDGEKRGQPRARRSWLAMTIASLIQLATALVFLWYLNHRRFGTPPLQAGPGIGGFGALKPPGIGSALPSGTEWLTALVVVGVLGLVGWRLWRTFGLRARGRREALADQLNEAVEQSIDDLESDSDARRAVIAAYARMMGALAGGGLPRQPPETALEYLGRVLATLEVPEGAVRRLTELFQFAKFSPHEVDTAMKADAIAALREIRSGLQGPRRVAPAAGNFAAIVR